MTEHLHIINKIQAEFFKILKKSHSIFPYIGKDLNNTWEIKKTYMKEKIKCVPRLVTRVKWRKIILKKSGK
jgi:hypothetical protein